MWEALLSNALAALSEGLGKTVGTALAKLLWKWIQFVIAASFISRLSPSVAIRLCTVRQITEANDPDLSKAIALLASHLRANVCDLGYDIRRWLEEVAQEKLEKRNKLEDYFFVCKRREAVVGVVYFHVYPKEEYAFVSYLVKEKRTEASRDSYVVTALASKVKDTIIFQHPNCKAILFELEMARLQDEPSMRLEKAARISLFQRMFPGCFELKIHYVQPKLALDPNREEEAQHLMVIPIAPVAKARLLPYREAAKMVKFVYGRVYGDAFETQESNDKYVAYLKALTASVLRAIPRQVELAKIDCRPVARYR